MNLKCNHFTRDGRAFLLTGQIMPRHCIVGRKFFLACFSNSINVNFGYFSYIKVSKYLRCTFKFWHRLLRKSMDGHILAIPALYYWKILAWNHLRLLKSVTKYLTLQREDGRVGIKGGVGLILSFFPDLKFCKTT